MKFYNFPSQIIFTLFIAAFFSVDRVEAAEGGENKENVEISVEEARQFFSANVPLFYGQQEFFEEARRNGALRQKYNELLASDQALAELARVGLEFRNQYAEELAKDFRRDSYGLVIDPDGEVLRRLSLYMTASETEWTDKPISSQRATILALHDTQQRYSLPHNWDAGKMLQYNYEAFLYYKRKITTYELLDEAQRKPAFPNVEAWKRSIIRSIDQARKDNFIKSAVRTIEEHKRPFVFRLPSGLFSTFFQIHQQELRSAELIFEGDVTKENPIQFGGRRLNSPFNFGDKYTRSSVSRGLASFWTWSLFRSKDKDGADFARALYTIPESFHKDPAIKKIGLVLPNSVRDRVFEKYLQDNNRTIVISLNDFLEVTKAFRFLFSEEPSQRKRLLNRYVIDAAEREVMLENVRTFLLAKNDESFEGLRHRLTKRAVEKGKDETTSHRSVSRIIQKDGLDAVSEDRVEGIRWWGYRDHPRYWQLRSSIAEASGATKFDAFAESKEKTKHRISHVKRFKLAYSNYFAQWPGAVRGTIGAVFLATYLYMGIHTAGPVLQVIASASEAKRDSRSNVLAFDSWQVKNWGEQELKDQQKVPLFHIVEGNIPTSEIPRYFSVFNKYHFDFEIVLNHEKDLKLQDPDADFKLITANGIRPFFQCVSIPSPIGYKLSALRVHDNLGELNVDKHFIVEKTADNIYQLNLLKNINGGIRFEAAYRKDEVLQKKFTDETFRDQRSLQIVMKGLREGGFVKIADALDAKLLDGPLTFSDLANIIGQESFYTFQSGKSDENWSLNLFANLADFEREGCLYGQCTAGNELLYLFIKYYQQISEEPFEVSRQSGLLRDSSGTVITGGHAHRFTRVYLEDGNFLHLDGTPQQMTDEDRAILAALNKAQQEATENLEVPELDGNNFRELIARINAGVTEHLNRWFGSEGERIQDEISQDMDIQLINESVDSYFRRERSASEMLIEDPEFQDRIKAFEVSVRKQIQAGHLFWKQILNSRAIQRLSTALTNELPLNNMFNTLHILTELRLGKLNYRQALDGVRRQFPGYDVEPSLPARAQLAHLLDAIFEKHAQMFAGIQDLVVQKGPSIKFAELADPQVTDPILNLLGFLRSNDWSPALSSFMKQNDSCIANFNHLRKIDGFKSSLR